MNNYNIISTLYESSSTVVYRATGSNGIKLILKKLNSDNPNDFILSRFKREYRIASSFRRADYVVKVNDMSEINGSPVIVMEDIGAEALSKHLDNLHLSLIEKIEVSIKMTSAIEAAHNANTIHLDVNPSNFVWNSNNDAFELIDFGLSSKSENEIPEILNPGCIEGNIAYLAPEQSGRMNRSVDYRADLYSLGVSMYEIFAESLPFCSDDVLEMIHCHIAKTPPDPAERNPEIPSQISRIILKLLNKSADLRYQSATGLKKDLYHCLKVLKERGRITYFDLAQNDQAGKFKVPQKLYSREKETKILLDAFECICGEHTKLLIVRGVSGIGKSALAGELKRRLIEKNAIFVSGKFDQMKENIPFAALVQAVNLLIDQIMSESDSRIAAWKKRILNAVGQNGKVLTDLFKKVELIIGKQPDIADLDTKESAVRSKIVFRNFIKAIARADNPLVLFFDDLQWSNKPSLDILRLLLSDPNQHLLIIGAYRSEEVEKNHIVSKFITELKKTKIEIDIIDLGPLDYLSTKDYVFESLKRRDEISEQLAKICFAATKGNPFFLKHLLISLQKDGLLYYSNGKWEIKRSSITPEKEIKNAIELMQRRILSLNQNAQDLLKLCSCVGDKFKLSTLSIITGKEKLQLYNELKQLVKIGFIFPSRAHRYFIDSNGSIEIRYSFLHDKIRQAAVYLIGEKIEKYHYRIGKQLIQLNNIDKYVFEIVNHLNKATGLIANKKDRLELATLNCIAGELSNKAGAWLSSYQYFSFGVGLLNNDCWTTSYDLALRLYSGVCEAAYLNNSYDDVDAHFDILIKNAVMLDRVKAYEAKINSLIAQGHPKNAIDIGFKYLAELGFSNEKAPNKLIILLKILLTIRKLKKIDFGNLKIEGQLNDKESLAAIKICMLLAPSLFVTRSANFFYIIITLINLFLKKGHHPSASYGIVAFGGVLAGKLKAYELSYCLAKAAMKMAESESGKPLCAKITYLASAFILPWKEQYILLIDNLKKKFEIGLDHGDLEYAAFCAYAYCYMSFLSGKKLDVVDAEMSHYSKIIKSQETVHNYLSIYHQTVKNLKNLTDMPAKLSGNACNQDALEVYFKQHQNDIGLFEIQSNKFFLCYLFGDIDGADKLYKNFLGALIPTALSKHNVPVVLFYRALCLYSHFSKQKKICKKEFAEFKSILKQYKRWSQKNPYNFEHKYLILSAAYSLIRRDSAGYLRKMNDSILRSEKLGYICDKALAYELLSSYYTSISNMEISKLYLEYAYNAYEYWGAHTKCKSLAKLHHGIFYKDEKTKLNKSRAAIYTTTKKNRNSIDLYSVVKASQVISREINFKKLLEKMLRIVVENAGAQNGILLLKEEGHFSVKGFYNKHKDTFATFCPDAIIPKSVINYVARTSDYVISDNAVEDNRFNKDKHILGARIKSIFCLPLKLKDRILGIIYLDNNSVEKAFTKDHSKTIHLLSTQAAISIENAMLFSRKRDLDELRIAKRMDEAETKAKSSFIAHISHDIRTPLNTILGYSELLSEKVPNDPLLNNYIRNIKSSGMLLLSLINKILELTRIESGKVCINSQYVSVPALVYEIRNQFDDKIKEKGLEFSIEIDKFFEHSLVKLDELILKQILINLIDNAYKYTEKGYINIYVIKSYCAGNKLEMSLIVEDSGVGISDTEKILEEFEQLQPFSDKLVDGMGLGLSIVKKLVFLVQAKILISSSLNGGAKIEIKFPKTETTENTCKTEQVGLPVQPVVSFNNQIILVTDDKVKNRDLIAEYLKPHALIVVEAENGKECVDIVQQNNISLVLMDIKMPVMDGIDATIAIKGKSKNANIPIIALTADISPETKDKALASGCDGFLLKPVTRNALLSELMRFLDHNRADSINNIEKISGSKAPLAIDHDHEKRADIIAELQRLKDQKWSTVSKIMLISKIDEFASDVEKIGKKYQSIFLEDWGKTLRENAINFHKNKAQTMMNQYPELIVRLERSPVPSG